MKYVITGGAGHIGTPLTKALLQAGQDVTVIGRTAAKLQPLADSGATAAVGSLEDADFLSKSFAGADAVFLMLPPNFAIEHLRQYQRKLSENYIAAITTNKVQNVVLLSSIGAHMGEGAGPVDGLADLEQLLAALPDVNVKILRPSYFMYNLFGMIPMMKNMNIMGGNFGGTAEKLVLVHTNDIAAVAAEELLALEFRGQTVRYIAGDERTTTEIAAVLSEAAGKPATPWVVFPDEQAFAAMKQGGLADTFAEAYTAMGKALREGKMQEDYWKNRPVPGPTKLEEFAKEFSAAFHQAG
jgi:uncharacterized protein YbjT (DUF2867 family)